MKNIIKFIKKTLWIDLLIALFIILLFVIPDAQALEITTATEKIKQLNQDMEKVTEELTSARKKQSKEQEALRAQELKINALNKKVKTLDDKINLAQQDLVEQQEKEKELSVEVEQRREQLAESLRALHATGQQPDLKLLFNQDDVIQFQRLLTYYQFFNQAIQKQITDLNEQLDEQAQLQEKIIALQEELHTEKKEQQQQQQELVAERKKRSNVLVKLDQTINSKDKELKELAASEKELQQVLLASQQSNERSNWPPVKAGPFDKQRGKLPWPTIGKVLHPFGSYRTGGQRRYNGMVISAPEGQSVYAVAPGRVVYADWLRGFGLLVIIDHGNKYMSLYAHNDTLNKQIGDVVKSNERIATVGTTGGLRQPGLYFEIRQNGKPINPQPWLAPRKN